MTVILLRHGVSTSNTAHTLAGRSPGVELTDRGAEQARSVAERLGGLPIQQIVISPMLRCQRTVAPLAEKTGLEPVVGGRRGAIDKRARARRARSPQGKKTRWFPDGPARNAVPPDPTDRPGR